MELPNDVDVQLAAAVACCFRNIRNSELNVEQSAQNNSTAQAPISNSRGVKRHKTLINQKKQILSQPIHLVRSNVDSRTVLLQSCALNKQNGTGILTAEVGIPTKIAEWKNKLDHLSFLFSSFGDGTISAIQMCTELDVEFRDLTTFLCYTSSTKRPVAVSDPVEVYAGSLVKLHQYCIANTDNGSERVLYAAIHEVISFWLRFLHRNNLNKYDRFWFHTRAVITQMFRNIIIQECIIAIKHSLASVLKELTMLVLESSEYSYGFYACEQIEYLMTVLSHQTSHVSY